MRKIWTSDTYSDIDEIVFIDGEGCYRDREEYIQMVNNNAQCVSLYKQRIQHDCLEFLSEKHSLDMLWDDENDDDDEK